MASYTDRGHSGLRPSVSPRVVFMETVFRRCADVLRCLTDFPSRVHALLVELKMWDEGGNRLPNHSFCMLSCGLGGFKLNIFKTKFITAGRMMKVCTDTLTFLY